MKTQPSIIARRLAGMILALTSMVHAGVVDEVRSALAANNFAAAESRIRAYQAERGLTPELAEAVSWLGRAALEKGQLKMAERYATQARTLSLQQLKTGSVDRDPHLPIALGAAIEVEAQVLAAQGQRAQAVAMLQNALRSYRQTSIRARLQKNLNLLSLVGRAAPPLEETRFLTLEPKSLAALRGHPVLLFFWAHWCGDCKYEGPILAQLRSQYGPRGLTVVAPTQFYGYAAEGQDATPATEQMWMDKVWRQFYPSLADVPVPISKVNFDTYGASTTPTLVLIDRRGIVELYHPGVMSYEELRSAMENVLKASSEALAPGSR